MMRLKESTSIPVSIKEWPESDRPREKLLRLGAEKLSDAELIAILLRTGSKKASALGLAMRMLSIPGSLHKLSALGPSEIGEIPGIGPAKAMTMVAAFELGRRIAATPKHERLKITSPEDVFARFAPLLSHLNREVFMILILNSANILIKDVRISEGILNSAIVHPREIFRTAILESAASIILVHNHPSGEVTPSREDRLITDKIVEAGMLLDMPVLDHIIVGETGYYSFREDGQLSAD